MSCTCNVPSFCWYWILQSTEDLPLDTAATSSAVQVSLLVRQEHTFHDMNLPMDVLGQYRRWWVRSR